VRTVDAGNLVTAVGAASTTSPIGIVIVNQIEPIAVAFSIPQGDYQRLSDVSDGFRKPLLTQALSQDTGAQLSSGELSVADNRVDPTTGTVEMKARFANTDEHLLPGEFANVKITLQTLAQATTIPAEAVNKGPDGAFAFVVGSDRRVAIRPLKVNLIAGQTAVIATGLQPGETVVTDGQMSLEAGSLVRYAITGPAEKSTP